MFKYSALIFLLGIIIGAGRASAADIDTRTCSLTQAYQCTSEDGCEESSIGDVALPRFIKIDLKAKVIKSLDKNIARETRFREIDRVQGMIVLHGTEQRGWSMALGEDSGTLTLTASGDDESFVIFGSCISP
ncbi:MAG TPA: hypothetical protein VFG19_05985 [Geobacteraceae bacterium]|nr:hypothetical protein [Geobacteraceae bacterium]